MDIIFVNSENDTHRLLLNLSVKINLKRTDKYFALSNLRKTIKNDHGKP